MDKTQHSFLKKLYLAFPSTLPVFTGFLILGLAYGVLMHSKGYNALWSLLFSIISFSGSMQFVAITFLTSIFAPLQALIMSLMIGARHLFYALSMLDKYKGTGKLKAFLIYYMCDETFAINASDQVPEGMEDKDFYFTVSFLNMFYWVSASFLGGVLGNFITINTAGLDFALTALFVVLFIEQLKSTKQSVCGLIGIVATGISLALFGANNMVIPVMVLIFLTLLGGKKYLCD